MTDKQLAEEYRLTKSTRTYLRDYYSTHHTEKDIFETGKRVQLEYDKAAVAKVINKRLDRLELREKIACWYYYKISAVHISKEEIVAWERLNESAKEFYGKEADQLLALMPDIGEIFSEGYNMGAQDADTDNKETAEEIRKQEEKRIIAFIEDYELFTNYSGDFKAMLISELKKQALKVKELLDEEL